MGDILRQIPTLEHVSVHPGDPDEEGQGEQDDTLLGSLSSLPNLVSLSVSFSHLVYSALDDQTSISRASQDLIACLPPLLETLGVSISTRFQDRYSVLCNVLGMKNSCSFRWKELLLVLEDIEDEGGMEETAALEQSCLENGVKLVLVVYKPSKNYDRISWRLPTMISDVPNELLSIIFDLVVDKNDLCNVCLASRVFQELAQPILYQEVDLTIQPPSHRGSIVLFLRTILENSQLRLYTKTIRYYNDPMYVLFIGCCPLIAQIFDRPGTSVSKQKRVTRRCFNIFP